MSRMLLATTPSNPQGDEFYAPKTDDIIPRHGLASGLFGRRTRSFGSGGRGRCVADWMALPCGFGTIVRIGYVCSAEG
jgi:hypothetical protein